jgi:sn-glycerol 3-phosphate transport system permease protein
MTKLLRISMYVLAAAWAVPLSWLIWTAFRPGHLSTSFTLSHFTFENFTSAWQGAPFGQYYLNTLIIVLGILFVQIVTITLAAYAFARLRFWGKNVLFLIVLVQLMIPAEALIFPNYNIISGFGLLDTKMGIMLPFFASAFGIFLLRQTFKSIPYELEEAARLDGCHLLQIIWKVYVPLAVPTYVAFGLVSVSHHWSNFLWPLIVTSSDSNRPLTVGLARFAQSFETGAQWAEVTAATCIVIFPLVLAFFIFQRQFVESFMQSGIK